MNKGLKIGIIIGSIAILSLGVYVVYKNKNYIFNIPISVKEQKYKELLDTIYTLANDKKIGGLDHQDFIDNKKDYLNKMTIGDMDFLIESINRSFKKELLNDNEKIRITSIINKIN